MLDLQTTNKDNLPPTTNKDNCSLVLEPQRKISTELNQVLSTTKRGMWTYEALELIIDGIDNETYSLRRANKAWNIPMNSIFDLLNGKTKSRKMGQGGVFMEKKDVTIIAWTLTMGECGLSTSL
jgi:hypothetical protein